MKLSAIVQYFATEKKVDIKARHGVFYNNVPSDKSGSINRLWTQNSFSRNSKLNASRDFYPRAMRRDVSPQNGYVIKNWYCIVGLVVAWHWSNPLFEIFPV